MSPEDINAVKSSLIEKAKYNGKYVSIDDAVHILVYQFGRIRNRQRSMNRAKDKRARERKSKTAPPSMKTHMGHIGYRSATPQFILRNM